MLTVGPRGRDAIRKALQMGADKGVHVSDEAIAGSDALATSLVLAEAVKKLDHDLVAVRHVLDRRRHGRRTGDAVRAARHPRRHLRLVVESRSTATGRSRSAATATPRP